MAGKTKEKVLGVETAVLAEVLRSAQDDRPHIVVAEGFEPELALAVIFKSPTNPRTVFNEDDLNELAKSIAEHGVLQPIVVRPMKGASGERPHPPAGTSPGAGEDSLAAYEIAAGERRWRASKIAGMTSIPAMIRNLSDGQLLEIQVIENNQRKDVTPLEEAVGYRRLVDSGYYGTGTAAREKIAQKIGRTSSYVYQRMKLGDLIPEVRDALAEGKITAHHAVPIARLQPEQQSDALAYCLNRWNGNLTPVAVLIEWIQESVLGKLSAAPWKKDDAELLPMAGPCTTCPKRMGAENALFADLVVGKDDRCSDPGCYEDKKKAFEARRVAEVESSTGAKPILVSTGYSGRNDLEDLDTYSSKFKKVAEGDQGAIPALVMHGGKKTLEQIWVAPKNVKADGTAASSSGVTPERREELRQYKVEQTTRFAVYEFCLAELTKPAAETMKALREKTPWLLAAVAVKCAIMDANSVGDTQDAARHPGRDEAAKTLGLKGYGYDLRRSLKPERLEKVSESDAWRAMFIAATYDEISFKDGSKPAGFVLCSFAEVLNCDVDLIRKEADYELLSSSAKKDIEKGLRQDPRAAIQPLDLKPAPKARKKGPSAEPEDEDALAYEIRQRWGSEEGLTGEQVKAVWSSISDESIKAADLEYGSAAAFFQKAEKALAYADGRLRGNDPTREVAEDIIADAREKNGLADPPIETVIAELETLSDESRYDADAAIRDGSDDPEFAEASGDGDAGPTDPEIGHIGPLGHIGSERWAEAGAVDPTPLEVASARECKGTPIDQDVLDVLARCRVEGKTLLLPDGQLERKLYERVNKVLENLGGRWNRKAKGHVFDDADPEERLQSCLTTGRVVDLKKELQFFPTPMDIAVRLCDLAEIGREDTVLEPSAGKGAIATAVRLRPHGGLICVEIHPLFVGELKAMGFTAIEGDFLQMDLSHQMYHRVVMNPPFSGQQDIDHVLHALKFVKPGGRLVSVMSPGWQFRENAKSVAFRAFLEAHGATVEGLPAGAFSESGTEIRSVIVCIDRPAEPGSCDCREIEDCHRGGRDHGDEHVEPFSSADADLTEMANEAAVAAIPKRGRGRPKKEVSMAGAKTAIGDEGVHPPLAPPSKEGKPGSGRKGGGKTK